MDFNALLKQEFVFLDGGMGTMLRLAPGELPERLNLTEPERVAAVHRAYAEAGSQIVYANTFGANPLKLANTGVDAAESIAAAIRLAREAVGEHVCVALDIGPTGQLLPPAGSMTFDAAYDAFRTVCLAGAAAGADLIVIETMSDLLETKAALLAAKENTSLPVMVTMSFMENGRTFTGCPVSAAAMTLEGLGASAIGINCSLGPNEILPMIREMAKWTSLPLIAKPNAGLPDPVTGAYDMTPEAFGEYMLPFAESGVQIFGGCCGTTPEFIRSVCSHLKNQKRGRDLPKKIHAICSGTRTVMLDMPRVIGERINPTGKKRMKQALLERDFDYLRNEAISQTEAGADILDVNVGTPGIDETAVLPKAVEAILEVTDLPLQLDSSSPAALEAALRIYPGKPIVNSVNGKEESLQAVLPLVKHYGAAIVGLTLDENGIPTSSEERFQIGKKILERAVALGIPKEDVFLDCLTLTASTGSNGPVETLTAVQRVHEELGLQTVLGVSNISFGLPNRPMINRNFLCMALTKGLTLPIMNPMAEGMMDAVRAYRMLAGFDENCADFIAAYQGDGQPAANAAPAPANEKLTLQGAVMHGLRQDAARLTEEALTTQDALDVVNNMLIPALDAVGEDYEKGKVFLPQLIQAATAAQSAFGVIKQHITAQENGGSGKKGGIVLATVKGDVHDIGKNIVRLLLDNYGYQVLDLGKDVAPQTIVDAAIEHQVRLVGLSALMTTTVGAMEETIRLLHEQYPSCKTVVGGAVLTADYAESIGADCYAKDAKATVDFAKQVYD
ncbi:MAG: homocysteine S-methyltransferase family protein [Oscillospiraceae bacterium]|nr:homocysteine S-methyltransferase family protein [Oscillospiraceae bacterium]